MLTQAPSKPTKRIAVAIELDHEIPWHHQCYRGILDYAKARGWQCITDPFVLGASGVSPAEYDGVVGRIGTQTAAVIERHGIPSVNHWFNSPVQGLATVLQDKVGGATLMAEHFLACGYKRYAMMVSNNRVGQLDQEAMWRVLEPQGFARPKLFWYRDEVEGSGERFQSFRNDLREWVRSLVPPVGVYVWQATQARYLAQICEELGLEVPRDVGILVSVDSPLISEMYTPTLSAVEHEFSRVGYQAAAMLDKLMQGEEVRPRHQLVKPQRLIVRESTDVFLCDDKLVTDAMRFIADHVRRSLVMEDVCSALNVSESSLRRRFEEARGRTVREEIVRLRVDYLKRLLTETKMSIGQIANECDFSSPGQFSRYFSSASGETPSVYRKRIKGW